MKLACVLILLAMGTVCNGTTKNSKRPAPIYPMCGIYKYDLLGGMLIFKKESPKAKLQFVGGEFNGYWKKASLIDKLVDLKQSGECHINMHAVANGIKNAIVNPKSYISEVKAALAKVKEPGDAERQSFDTSEPLSETAS